jgi:NAD(P)-dependent dehydrogenase (short-subunit alcohol dehydrogenase family)
MMEEVIRQGLISLEDIVGLKPVKRLAEPEEIAESAAWLCSGLSSFITGHAMAVDGGWTAQ